MDDVPELADKRDSSFIAQEADIVIMIKRIVEGNQMTNESIVGVQKNRRTGKTGHFILEYKGGKLIPSDRVL